MKRKFRSQLLAYMVGVFALIFLSIFLVQTKLANENSRRMLTQKQDDTITLMRQTAQRHELVLDNFIYGALAKVDSLAMIYELSNQRKNDPEYWDYLKNLLNVDEVNITDENGVIIFSTRTENVGYDFHNSEQTREFLPALNDPTFRFVQGPMPRGIDGKNVLYVGAALLDPEQSSIVQIGLLPEKFENLNEIGNLADLGPSLKVGNGGTMLICNLEGEVLASRDPAKAGENLFEQGFDPALLNTQAGSGKGNYFGKNQMYIYSKVESFYSDNAEDFMDDLPDGYYIVGLLPMAEVYAGRNLSCAVLLGATILLFVLVYFAIAFLVQRQVISGILRVNSQLEQITGGDLNVRLDVVHNEEFRQLSAGINTTVDALKGYIELEKQRLQRELELAGRIQASALPLPGALENVPEIAVFAAMRPARDVGGDFYDFFPLNDNEIAFLIADVSGKGIAAALFMMRVKGEIKGNLQRGLSLAEALSRANDNLCEHNDEMMFATVFAAVFSRQTGEVEFVNAGHNPPILLRGSKAEVLKDPPGPLLAALPGIGYKALRHGLQKQDVLVLYTDGITEALSEQDEFYGMTRLEAFCQRQDVSPEVQEVGQEMLLELEAFTAGAEQADDITLLVFKWEDKADE